MEDNTPYLLGFDLAQRREFLSKYIGEKKPNSPILAASTYEDLARALVRNKGNCILVMDVNFGSPQMNTPDIYLEIFRSSIIQDAIHANKSRVLGVSENERALELALKANTPVLNMSAFPQLLAFFFHMTPELYRSFLTKKQFNFTKIPSEVIAGEKSISGYDLSDTTKVLYSRDK